MHFFTEPTKLDPIGQSTNDVFGPKSGSKYKVSSKHKIYSGSSSKLFACQDALMLVLPTIDSSKNLVSGKVNLILKPLDALPIRMQPVKYYIFRGVDRSSYLSGNVIIADDKPNNCEFINKFHFNWTASLPIRGLPSTAVPDPKIMGFDEILATDPIYRAYYIEELFNSSASLTVPLQDYSSVKVREGEWIGNIPASGNFEFEIITDTENMPITLEYAEFESYEIDGSSPVFNPDIPTLETLTIREKVLNYIDPAAFFGMHFDVGIRIHNGYTYPTTGIPSNTTQTLLKKKQSAYDDVISKFLNKNVVYLDIRSERGYSYGFYQNYQDASGDILKLKSKSDLLFHNLDYSNMEWPLVNLNNPPGNLNALVPGDPIYLKLSTKDNDTPVLFTEDPKLFGTNNKKQFYNQEDIKDLNKKIRLFIPNAMDNSNKVNVAWQIKLQYFREKDHEDSPDSVFKNKNYLDSVFGGINSVFYTIPTKFNHVQNTKRQYVNNGSFAFVTDTGFYFNNGTSQTVLFYSELAYSHKKSGSLFSKLKLKSTPASGILDRKNATFSKTTATVDTVSVDLLQLIGYNRTNNESTPECNLHLLGLSKAEWDAIQGATTSLSGNQVYIRFEKQTIASTTHPCFKYKLIARGLDSSFVVSEVSSFGSTHPEIIVYGVSDTLLFSKEFAAAQNVASDLLDPSKLTSYSRVKTVTYDKSTPEVDALFTGGKNHLTDDSSQNITSVFVDNFNPGVNILGNLYYPVKNVSGNDVIDPDGSPYPLIVITHGNGQYYYQYNDLGEFLAKNGFIVASISNLADQNFTGEAYLLSDTTITLNYTGSGTPAYSTDPEDFIISGNGGLSTSNAIVIYNRATQKITQLIRDGSGPYNWNLSDVYTWWSPGIDFETFITPRSKVWIKTGSSSVVDIKNFGINWLSNSGPVGSKKADLTKTGTRLVEVNALGYSQNSFNVIKNMVDTLTDLNDVHIAYPETTVDRYFGTLKDGMYYLIHIISTSVSGSTVTINAEVKNAQINMFVSIDEQGLGILGRANNLYPHLQVIKSIMGADVQNNIGLIGHSRGAEAVVRSATDLSSGTIPSFDITDPTTRSGDLWNNVPNNLKQIQAVISLAPTDQIGRDSSNTPIDAAKISNDIPYYALYGSMDGDVQGFIKSPPENRNSAFSIYDRSINSTEKSMSFVYGATHNGFITTNKDQNKNPNNLASVMLEGPQQAMAKGYFNAFMRRHLKGESYWAPYFYGDLIPLSVREDEIYQQYQNMENPLDKWIENFTNFPNPTTDVKLSGSPIDSIPTQPFAYGDLVNFKSTIKSSSPHASKGIKVTWTTASNLLSINVDKSGTNNLTKDVSMFTYLSFRIGHIYNDTSGFTYEDLSQIKVLIKGLNSTEVSFRTIEKTIPPPFVFLDNTDFIKSSMVTIRLPLVSFNGTTDLSQVKYVEFEFPGAGAVIMDDFEFTD
jgi:hypothetical protein